MKILFFGGQKSGKSRLAEQKILSLASCKPTYIATYDNRYGDEEMQRRIQRHRLRRRDRFEIVEEPLFLDRVVEEGGYYLVDCLSMWILNLLEKGEDFAPILERLLAKEAVVVFVLNDIGRGVIPIERLSREYVDLSGEIGQRVAQECEEVYEVVLGMAKRLK